MIKKHLLLALLLIIINSFAQEKTEIKWWNPANSEFPVIAGKGWSKETNSIFHRLPSKSEKKVRNTVWELSKQSAGLSIRFWSNAPNIRVKYKLKGGISMPHMPATGVSGLDLYSKTSDGEWLRNWGNYSIKKNSTYNFTINENSDSYTKHGREYQLFLPLYNEVETLEIGLDEASFFKALPLREEKPIVVYGTSISQGACASRPGMAWTSILERKLERPFVNLGFSGNGRLEPELIDLMLEIDAKLYILDCLPNLSPKKDDTRSLIIAAIKKIKGEKPKTPILITAHIGYANALTNNKSNIKYSALNKAMQSAFYQLKSDGYTSIFLLKKEDLNLNPDSYVDSIHPNDLGMMQYANAYERKIRVILNETLGNTTTTIPKTQNRDISVYKWEDRHQKILKINKINPPKICFFGNSIAHFWGGEPNAPITNGKDSWDNVLKPLGVRNFGFGWDRIENMLWRVYHDELDGFKADKIIVMAGTNNLHLNNEKDIVKGVESLLKAIKIRQPKSNIILIGILPRNEKETQVEKLNLKIEQLANLEGIAYKNIGDALLLKNKKINQTLFTDGLHPNHKGYELIAKKIAAIVKNN